MASIASTTSSKTQTDQVLVEESGSVRTFILNRPKQLNALSLPMISRSLELFLSYEEDPEIKLIVMKGKGRAFCAGGDVAAAVPWFMMFVKVWFLNGIVMGGGVGVSIHGRFRVATENSIFAMPETALGHFPDAGEYLGLTGSRLDCTEMLACGLATHYVPSERLSSLEKVLHKLDSTDPAVVAATISEFSEAKPNQSCFSRRTVEEIISALEMEAAQNQDDWISSTIQSLKIASPTSLKISLRSIREGRLQGIGKCLVREYRMVCHVMRGDVSKDLFEGCRAILLDKDRNPKWEPSKLELVSEQMVESYFSKIEEEDWEDVQLPARSEFRAHAIAKL